MWKKLGIIVMTTALSTPAFAAKPDFWITTKTKLGLWTTGDVHSTSINVDTINGVVTLHGRVESAAERERAAREAKKIEGVKSVRNLLQVVAPDRQKAVAKSDKEIKDAVEAKLKADSALSDSSITIKSVTAGVVLLGGTTPGISEEVCAVRDAVATEGVKRVATEIKGGTRMDVDRDGTDTKDAKRTTAGKHASDGWLTTEVKFKLVGDEAVPAMDVNVDTRDGVVSLFGTVPTNEAKQAAEMDAKKVDGVAKVENELQVVPASEKKMVKMQDEAIEKKIKRSLKDDSALAHVDVQVKGGVVRLAGTVPSRSEMLEASMVSRATEGVRAVSNELQIKSKND